MTTATATKAEIQLHQGQIAALGSSSRVTVMTAGQGGGKTLGAYYWLLANMQAFPGESHLVGFPDYGLLTRVILNQPDPDRRTLIDWLRDMGERPKLHAQEGRIECKSGQIFFASAENLVAWEGAHVKTAWLDEFDMCPLGAYRRAMERTRMRNGYVLLTGTPRRVAWVKQELAPLWERHDPFVTRIQFPSTANPRYSSEAMEEARRHLPLWEYKRLHLGELAAAEGGNIFRREWWQHFTLSFVWPLDQMAENRKKASELVQCWDTAYKEKTQADPSVCATWARIAGKVYLLDIWRKRVGYPDLNSAVRVLYAKYQPSRVLVEDAASGQSIVQDLRRSTGLPIVPVPVDRDKLSRATAVTGMVQSGQVYIPDDAAWVHDYVEELAAFPDPNEHDDQVDVTSMGLAWMKRPGGIQVYA